VGQHREAGQNRGMEFLEYHPVADDVLDVVRHHCQGVGDLHTRNRAEAPPPAREHVGALMRVFDLPRGFQSREGLASMGVEF
jgi:hypothetical protein